MLYFYYVTMQNNPSLTSFLSGRLLLSLLLLIYLSLIGLWIVTNQHICFRVCGRTHSVNVIEPSYLNSAYRGIIESLSPQLALSLWSAISNCGGSWKSEATRWRTSFVWPGSANRPTGNCWQAKRWGWTRCNESALPWTSMWASFAVSG